MLVTKNLTPGKTVYGEKKVEVEVRNCFSKLLICKYNIIFYLWLFFNQLQFMLHKKNSIVLLGCSID